jgi:ArsR family transcriptional regulator, arsenate/arsenite/antimonite-responsive transcriptional repressor
MPRIISLSRAATPIPTAVDRSPSALVISIPVDMFRIMTATATVQRTASLFHALSDNTRLEIVDMLRGGERCVCELQEELRAAQSRLSFHLRVLKEAGLVNDRKEGRWVYYSLDADALAELTEAVAGLKPSRRALAVRSASACCD